MEKYKMMLSLLFINIVMSLADAGPIAEPEPKGGINIQMKLNMDGSNKISDEKSEYDEKFENTNPNTDTIINSKENTNPNTSINSKEHHYLYRTAYTCEREEMNIQCEAGYVINVIWANYGRLSQDICNPNGYIGLPVNCRSMMTYRILTERCSGMFSCSVNASNKIFGDPCPSTPKYLEVHYSCEAECPVKEGFFYQDSSNQCFKLFYDHTYTWEDAKNFCLQNGLQLAKPYDARGLRGYILQRYSLGSFSPPFTWVGAKGDGQEIRWILKNGSYGEVLTDKSPLWWTGNSPVEPTTESSDHCLRLLTNDDDWKVDPNGVYSMKSKCTTSHFALCELSMTQISNSGNARSLTVDQTIQQLESEIETTINI